MRAIQNTAFGNPLDTLQLIDTPALAQPGRGEVRVAMEYAPINGNDMLVITGQFKFDTPLPSVVGNEGVGRVVAIGEGVTNVAVGDLIAPPVYSWTWREELVIPAAGLFALPAHVDPRQLAMLAINPVTAILLFERYVDLQKGDWIVQNMGNGGIGRTIIALAKERGVRTISFVRRQELVDELVAAGGDLVLVDRPDADERIKAAVNEGEIRLAIDGLGGKDAARLIGLLSQNGTFAGYSFVGGDMIIPVNVIDLHARGVIVRGIYQGLPEYAAHIPAAQRLAAQLMADGKLSLAVDAVYPLDNYAEAVAHSLRGGKVLLDLRTRP